MGKKLNILGVTFGHDGSACVIKDGKLVSALSKERLVRIKKATGLTEDLILAVLKEANLKPEDIDAIGCTEYEQFTDDLPIKLKDKNKRNFPFIYGNKKLTTKCTFFGREVDLISIPHHLAHCASAFYTSNFDKSWCFSLDSSGKFVETNSLIAFGNKNKLEWIECPKNMVGWFYANFTSMLGVGDPLYKAGSTMALASFYEPRQETKDNIKEYINMTYDDSTAIPPIYVNDKKGVELFKKLSHGKKGFSYLESASDEVKQIASDLQYIFEESILNTVNNKIQKDEINNLCLAGGSFLNCNVNTRIKKETRFDSIHHFPACGDDGNAVGAALYVAHHIFDEPRQKYEVKDLCYLGPSYSYIEPDYKKIASMLADGKIIGWFFGRSEFGPRALGNRSLLADPRNLNHKIKLNSKIKKREKYRPFGPAVLEEESHKWFDFDGPSPYMLYTAQVLQPEKIPAVLHVDNSARMQTVNSETNEPYYKLIKEFFKQTGVPILLNTSLNGPGQPIVESEEDAINFLNTTGVDAVVINGRLILNDSVDQ
jgi:carbamoyltransferase